MSIILNIDTSIETASLSIARDGIILVSKINRVQKEHATFLHLGIRELFTELSLSINQVDAIAVTNGPGSYTGLRVGLACAKGLCYALNKPLITIGTLNAIANAGINEFKKGSDENNLFCPMIDARRMEVYTALFDQDMKEILPTSAMILDEYSFEPILQKNKIIFLGSGISKWSNIVHSENAHFIYDTDITNAVCQLSNVMFLNNKFTDLTYSEPLYVKEFYSP